MPRKKKGSRFTAQLLAGLALSQILAGCVGQNADSQPIIAQLPGSPTFTRSGPEPLIDFGGVQTSLAGEPTRILVLGTPHLGSLPEEVFDPAHLALVLDRLESFSPDVIAIEAIGGRACEEIQRYEAIYPSAQSYCANLDASLSALGMTRPQAAAALEDVLAELPANPSVSERRRLALLFYGAGEPWSATLQWSLVAKEDRLAKDGLTAEVIGLLDRRLASRNENRLIGVELAARLGLDKLAAMDDHSADIIQTRAPQTLSPVIQSVWGTSHPREQEFSDRRQRLFASPESSLRDYVFLNSEVFQRYTIEEDFGLAAATPDENGVARQYLSWWQARGLRMAANIIEAAGNEPGANVLVITGSSHNAYLEAYLDQMHDVELVSVEGVLLDE